MDSKSFFHFQTSELGVTEHMEGDECKFAVWTGRAPISDYRIVLRASSLETKQLWVKKLREVIQETYFSSALPLSLPKSPAKLKPHSQRSSRFEIAFCFFITIFHYFCYLQRYGGMQFT